jgi:hypothetical protein
LSQHGQDAAIEACNMAPSQFYYLPPVKPKTPTADEIRRCNQLHVDKLAAEQAGNQMLALAAKDKATGSFPRYRGDVNYTMDVEFRDAVADLRGKQLLHSIDSWTPEAIQAQRDLSCISDKGYDIYHGEKTVSQAIEDNLFLNPNE